jgi:hypothetical protein
VSAYTYDEDGYTTDGMSTYNGDGNEVSTPGQSYVTTRGQHPSLQASSTPYSVSQTLYEEDEEESQAESVTDRVQQTTSNVQQPNGTPNSASNLLRASVGAAVGAVKSRLSLEK